MTISAHYVPNTKAWSGASKMAPLSTILFKCVVICVRGQVRRNIKFRSRITIFKTFKNLRPERSTNDNVELSIADQSRVS